MAKLQRPGSTSTNLVAAAYYLVARTRPTSCSAAVAALAPLLLGCSALAASLDELRPIFFRLRCSELSAALRAMVQPRPCRPAAQRLRWVVDECRACSELGVDRKEFAGDPSARANFPHLRALGFGVVVHTASWAAAEEGRRTCVYSVHWGPPVDHRPPCEGIALLPTGRLPREGVAPRELMGSGEAAYAVAPCTRI